MTKVVIVNDKMQKNYKYTLVAKEGKDFHPDFKPELSPMQMLEYGVFEGHYLTDCQNEFPVSWFKKAKLSFDNPDASLNLFQIKSRLSLQEWKRRGWILQPDPRGWFQWYCRYYYGRRIPDLDLIQIKRWKAFKRHKAQVLKNCSSDDFECRKKQRQALLQWAYNPFF